MLRVYILERNPLKELQLLSKYTVQVFTKTWDQHQIPSERC